MAVIDIQLHQIINNPNVTWPYLYVAGNCGNHAFPEMPGFSTTALEIAEKTATKVNVNLIDIVSFLGNDTASIKNYFKIKLGQPNLTLS